MDEIIFLIVVTWICITISLLFLLWDFSVELISVVLAIGLVSCVIGLFELGVQKPVGVSNG